MGEPKRVKRRILSAGAGMVTITALEGLACGNPVAPRHDMPHEQDPEKVEQPGEDAVDPSATAAPAVSASASAATEAPEVPPADSVSDSEQEKQ
jgi:hypothetical protein